MSSELHDIEKAAEGLSLKQHACLVRRLIAGLDLGEDQDAEQVWLDEAEVVCPITDQGRPLHVLPTRSFLR